MKFFLAACLVLGMALSTSLYAQNYITRNGEARFFSHAPLEDIEAVNKDVGVIVSPALNIVKIVVKIISFQFDKSLMQEHFNENYMETPKFPIASFTGSFLNKEKVNFSNPGTYQTLVTGDLLIHGITRKREIPATLVIQADGKVSVASEFMVKLEDHQIKIPSAVGKNIAEEVKVNFNAVLNKQ